MIFIENLRNMFNLSVNSLKFSQKKQKKFDGKLINAFKKEIGEVFLKKFTVNKGCYTNFDSYF